MASTRKYDPTMDWGELEDVQGFPKRGRLIDQVRCLREQSVLDRVIIENLYENGMTAEEIVRCYEEINSRHPGLVDGLSIIGTEDQVIVAMLASWARDELENMLVRAGWSQRRMNLAGLV